jgi:hypothetical protein
MRLLPVTTASQGNFGDDQASSSLGSFDMLWTRVPRGVERWCREGELNPQGTKYRRILSPLRLPVPPSRLVQLKSLASSDLVDDGRRDFRMHWFTGVSSGVTWRHVCRASIAQPLHCRQLVFRRQVSVSNRHLDSLVSH